MRKRILIIGGNGSGKTTFAKKLAEKTGLPLIHLDALYWKDNWEHVSTEEFDALLSEELKKDQWIIDGNMKRTLPLRLKYCDTVFLFDFPRTYCLWGAIKRTLLNYGKSRDDMGGYCPEKFSPEFYKSIWHGNKKMIDNFYALLKNTVGINIIIFRSRRDINNFFELNI